MGVAAQTADVVAGNGTCGGTVGDVGAGRVAVVGADDTSDVVTAGAGDGSIDGNAVADVDDGAAAGKTDEGTHHTLEVTVGFIRTSESMVTPTTPPKRPAWK